MTLLYITGNSLPLVIFGALPQQFGPHTNIDVREALPPSTLSQRMYLLYCQSCVSTAPGTPVPSLDVVLYCHPFVTFGALPGQLRMRIDIDFRQTSAAAALGELLH